MAHLMRLYPDTGASVLYMWTSNYKPASVLGDASAVVHVRPPSEEAQAEWCRVVLQADVAAAVSCVCARAVVEVTLDTPPPVSDDMRRLETWRLCVAYSTIAGLREHLQARAQAQAGAELRRCRFYRTGVYFNGKLQQITR